MEPPLDPFERSVRELVINTAPAVLELEERVDVLRMVLVAEVVLTQECDDALSGQVPLKLFKERLVVGGR